MKIIRKNESTASEKNVELYDTNIKRELDHILSSGYTADHLKYFVIFSQTKPNEYATIMTHS